MAYGKSIRSIFSLIAALLAVFLMAVPAVAHHKDGHEQGTGNDGATASSSEESSSSNASSKGKGGDKDGDADSDPKTTTTEDNDTNDGGTKNNVVDKGDNKHPSGKDRSVEHGNPKKNPNQGKAESDPDDDGRGPDRTNRGPDKPGGTGGADLADQDGNNGCGNDDDFEDDNEGHCGKAKTKTKKSPPVKGKDEVKGTKNCPAGSKMVSGGCVKNDDEVKGAKDGKITICHATGSSTNPYVTITISTNGLNGHADHAGDIIPMPAGGCPTVEAIVLPPGTSIPPVKTDDAEPTPDVVLGEQVGLDEDDSSVPPAVAAELEERTPSQVEVLGAVLPFTGASILSFLAASLGLIAAGFAALKLRKN